METLNDQNLPELSIFGICDKQLACHSCRVNIRKLYNKFPEPKEEEDDVLDELGDLYEYDVTRMSC
jgi:ferredoxin